MLNKIILILIVFAASYFPSIIAQSIVINELMSSNSVTIADEDGEYSDWIELFNPQQNAVDLTGYGISDDPTNPFKWVIPNVSISSQGHLLIFASDKNKVGYSLHTNFKLSSEGETVIITNPQGVTTDQVSFVKLGPDVSFGRQPDGVNSWFLFQQATPGDSNTAHGYSGVTEDPVVSPTAGFYNSSATVNITTSSINDYIYFTLDGSEPDETSQLFTASFNLDSTIVLRAKAFSTGLIPSKCITNTYLINFTTDLPLISLSTDPANLFDEEIGIYAFGDSAESTFPYFGANFWKDWERPVHIELFENNGLNGFSLDAGLQIFGGYSRAYPQKSLAIFARGRYGFSSINYRLFDELPFTEYQAFVLRNSGDDWHNTMFRDGMMTSLVNDNEIDKQAYKPSVVFINGRYWGMLNIREKTNEHYLAQHYGLNPDSVDILENFAQVNEGNNEDYLELYAFIENNSLVDDQNYDYVKTKMDVNNFIRYCTAQIYFDNTDWPGNNSKYWRSNNNGRWRWILFDTDFGFGLNDPNNYMNNTLEIATALDGPNWPNPPWSTLFLRKLLENPAFKNDFINCIADYSNSIFDSAIVVNKINSIKALIESEISRHGSRWNTFNFEEWLENVQILRDFAKNRIIYLRNHFIQKFGLAGLAPINLSISDKSNGSIKVNSLTINSSNWNGEYFLEIPIRIIAQSKPGFRFVRWEGYSSSNEDTLSITLSGPINLIAIFDNDSVSALPKIVINEINYNSSSTFNPEDWIELYNAEEHSVGISNWIFKDSDDSHIFKFPQGTIINPYEYLVLCTDSSLFKPLFSEVHNFIGNTGFGLSGSGELIRLYDDQMNIIDSLTYDDVSPWPTAPDGNGSTLSLKNPILDNSLSQNWAASFKNGTPGQVNDVFIPIPVELALFTVDVVSQCAIINWETASETNNHGFYIQRYITNDWQSIHFAEGKGTSTSVSSYEFVDTTISQIKNTFIKYRLKQVDYDGSVSYSGEIEVEINVVPEIFQLYQNHPNPFNPMTKITYSMSSQQFVTLKVYDLLGKELNTLVDEVQPPGIYEVEFNVANFSSGVYFYRLSAGSFIATKKMTIIK